MAGGSGAEAAAEHVVVPAPAGGAGVNLFLLWALAEIVISVAAARCCCSFHYLRWSLLLPMLLLLPLLSPLSLRCNAASTVPCDVPSTGADAVVEAVAVAVAAVAAVLLLLAV